MIVYILLGGYPPFYDEDDAKLFAQIKTVKYKNSKNTGEIKELIYGKVQHLATHYPLSTIQHPTSNIQHPTSNIQHPPPNTQGKFQFHSPFFDPVSNEAKDLIRKMLTRDPANRPSGKPKKKGLRCCF